MSQTECTRRTLLCAAASAAAGASAAGAPASANASAPVNTNTAASSQAALEGDAKPLSDVLQVERALALSYRAMIRAGLLRRHAAATVRQLYAHELAHARVLTRALRDLGAPLPAPVGTPAAAEAVLASHHVEVNLAAPAGEPDCLKLLLACETAAEAAYFAAVSKLQAASLLRLCAAALASEAQHSALIGALLYPKDVSRALPDPFITGVR